MGPRTVLVHGDFHLAVRLRAALGDAGLPVVAHLTSPVELEEAIAALAPGVLVTAMALEGRDIMPAVSQAVRRLPGLRVIVLTPWIDRAGARAALAAGACGVLITGEDDAALVRKVVFLATGGAMLVETSIPDRPPGSAAAIHRATGGEGVAGGAMRREAASKGRSPPAAAAQPPGPTD